MWDGTCCSDVSYKPNGRKPIQTVRGVTGETLYTLQFTYTYRWADDEVYFASAAQGAGFSRGTVILRILCSPPC